MKKAINETKIRISLLEKQLLKETDLTEILFTKNLILKYKKLLEVLNNERKRK